MNLLISFLGIPRRSSHVLEPTCPRNCLCLEDFKFVQCSNAQLTHIPMDLPKTAAIIDLSHNNIAELRAEDFANLSKVVEINISHNLIKQLDKEVNIILSLSDFLCLINPFISYYSRLSVACIVYNACVWQIIN